MKIIVTGSLGHIGKPLTQDLVRKGHSVTVISSNPGRQKNIEALGATAAIGSMEDVNFLASVFTGADAVHAMIPPNNAVPDPMARNIRVRELSRASHLAVWGKARGICKQLRCTFRKGHRAHCRPPPHRKCAR